MHRLSYLLAPPLHIVTHTVQIAQRALANSVEGRVEGLGCPICGEVFGQGRPLRMHLMSPRHGLDSWALREAIEASQKRLVYRPLEGVTGRTKKMAEEARKERQRRNKQAAAATGGASGDGWEGTAVGHGKGSGKYVLVKQQRLLHLLVNCCGLLFPEGRSADGVTDSE